MDLGCKYDIISIQNNCNRKDSKYMKLSESIKELRKQRNLRQEQLAEAMGVSTASVSKWETGQCAPELTVLMELADFFEVSMDTLVGHSLNADRLEALIKQMEEAVDNRDEETAASLCEKILRNYPNSVRAVDACADCCYRLFIYTQKNTYMEQCIAQTKRLMILNQGELERKRLERIHDLGNQYELLSQWDTAKDYYEQSNVGGSDDAAIAGCLLNQGKTQEAIKKLSDMLVESIFQQFHAVNRLADGWSTVGENEKACAALEWMYGAMESLRYNPTTMILIQAKLAGLYHDCGKKEMMEAALRKASVLAAETDTQEVGATADFLQIEEARKMLINATGNKDLLMGIATSAGSSFAEVVNEVLQ